MACASGAGRNREIEIVTTPASPHRPPRRALRALLLLLALAALAVSASPAGAAKSCGRQVLDDWYDGRIDGTYDLHCYDDAIEIIPRDVRDYSSAEDDIRRALQAALRGEPAPPNRGGDVTDGGDTDEPIDPGDEPISTTPDDPPPADTVAAGPELDGDSASSVPVPLLILAGLALLLVAGGSAGYVVRRLQARRIPPPSL